MSRALGGVQITSRPSGFIERDLEFTPEEIRKLAGKRVLSVGEGASDFAKTLERRGSKAVAFDWWYAFDSKTIGRNLRISGGPDGRDINRPMRPETAFGRLPGDKAAGLLPNLPFRGASFDQVVMPHLMYWLFPSREELALESLREMLRVLKPGGELRFNAGNGRWRALLEKLVKEHSPGAATEPRGDDVLIIRQAPATKPNQE